MYRPIGSTLVAHLPHFLDEGGEVTRYSYETRKLGLQLVRIVEAATSQEAGRSTQSALPCPRRPGNRACEGSFIVQRSDAREEIGWVCSSCGDNGIITGWRDTAFDLSVLPALDRESCFQVRMPSPAFQAIRGEALEDPDLCRLIAAATLEDGEPVLRGTSNEMGRLLGNVAAQVQEERRYRHLRLKEQALAALVDLPAEARTEAAAPALRIEVVAERLPRELARLVIRQGAVVDHRDLLTRLKVRIDGVLAGEPVGHDQMGLFILALEDTAEEIRRAELKDQPAALAAYAHFMDTLRRMYGRVDDETEMQTFCTYLCCEAVGYASRIEETMPETAALINSLVRAFARDEEYWFDCVPGLVRALELGPSGRSWLLDAIHEHMPARDSGHQEDMERLVADLGG